MAKITFFNPSKPLHTIKINSVNFKTNQTHLTIIPRIEIKTNSLFFSQQEPQFKSDVLNFLKIIKPLILKKNYIFFFDILQKIITELYGYTNFMFPQNLQINFLPQLIFFSTKEITKPQTIHLWRKTPIAGLLLNPNFNPNAIVLIC